MLPHGNDSWLQRTVALAPRPALSSCSDTETVSAAFLAARFLSLESHVRGVSQPRWWAPTFDLHEFRDASSSVWPPAQRGWEP